MLSVFLELNALPSPVVLNEKKPPYWLTMSSLTEVTVCGTVCGAKTWALPLTELPAA